MTLPLSTLKNLWAYKNGREVPQFGPRVQACPNSSRNCNANFCFSISHCACMLPLSIKNGLFANDSSWANPIVRKNWWSNKVIFVLTSKKTSKNIVNIFALSELSKIAMLPKNVVWSLKG